MIRKEAVPDLVVPANNESIRGFHGMNGQCSCWCDYPNIHHQHKNGNWKCVDKYRCIRPLEKEIRGTMHFEYLTRKTLCERIKNGMD